MSVCLAVKAVHIEVVPDLSKDAFIACLRRFIACRGKPTLIMNDHGKNYVGALREIKELFEFLAELNTWKLISDFCAS